MLISEILNTKVEYKVVDDSPTYFSTIATIGNRSITFAASKFNAVSDFWSISFYEKNDAEPEGTYARTGSGNELEVFGMVKDSLVDFIAKRRPQMMTFIADKSDDSSSTRGDVYEKLLKRFKIKDYTLSRTDRGNHDSFKLVKN